MEIIKMSCITIEIVDTLCDRGYYEKKQCEVCNRTFYTKKGKYKPRSFTNGIILRNKNCVTCSQKCSREKLKNRWKYEN